MPLLHPLRSHRYPPHHPFGCGRHHLQKLHAGAIEVAGSYSQRVKNLLPSFMLAHYVKISAKLVHTRRTYPFQHYYQLSTGDGFRSSLQPS